MLSKRCRPQKSSLSSEADFQYTRLPNFDFRPWLNRRRCNERSQSQQNGTRFCLADHRSFALLLLDILFVDFSAPNQL